MRKNINQEIIEGRVYDHSLVIKKVTNKKSDNFGKDYISGILNIATDEDGLNVIPVHYTFVKEFYNSGSANSTFTNLKRILNEGTTWVKNGKDAAMKVKAEPSLALNDYFPDGEDKLISQQRNEGGFLSFVSELNADESKRRRFTLDVIINGISLTEADPENNIKEDFLKINAAAFDYNNRILPVTLIAKDSFASGSINYFMGLNPSPSNPVYTKVMGEIINTTIVITKTMENAFGGSIVDTTTKKEREWVINWAQPNPYEFGIEETITQEELEKAIGDRNTYLAEQKQASKEYYEERKKKSSTPSIPANSAFSAMPVPTSEVDFNF